MNIRDQVVLVTGSSRGLGKAIAKAFAREGATVVVNYLQDKLAAENVVDEIGGGGRAFVVQADVRDPDQVKAMFDRIKELSGGRSPTTIINNALASGFYFNGNDRKHLADITPSDFTSQLSVSLLGSLNTLQASLPAMKSAKFGRIINIGTNLFQNPVVPYHDYTSAKAALLGFTRTSAAELGEFGVTVNMVSGGLLETTDASAVTPKEVFDTIRAISPLKKVCTPDEVADAVLFFASPWSRGVTGQQLIVDGGLVMN